MEDNVLFKYHAELTEKARKVFKEVMKASLDVTADTRINALIGAVVHGFAGRGSMDEISQITKIVGRVFTYALVIRHVKGVDFDTAVEQGFELSNAEFRKNYASAEKDIGPMVNALDKLMKIFKE